MKRLHVHFTTSESTVYGTNEIKPAAVKAREAACCAPTCCAPHAA
jgi:hypothetical protein